MALQSLRPDVPGQIVRGAQLNRQLGQREIEHNALVAQREITNQRADRTLDQSGRRLDYNIGRQGRQDQIAAADRKRKVALQGLDYLGQGLQALDTYGDNAMAAQPMAERLVKDAEDLFGYKVTVDQVMDPAFRKAAAARLQSDAARIAQANREQPTNLQKNLTAAGLQPGEPEFQKAMLGATQKSPKVRDQEIWELLSRGITLQDAQDIVADRVKVETDREGNIVLVNTTDGSTRMVRRAGGSGPGGTAGTPTAVQPPSGLQPIEEAAQGTGPLSMFQAITDATIGAAGEIIFGTGQTFADNTANRQRLREFRQIVKASLTNNPRFPQGEMAIVAELLPDPDEFFANPASAIARLGSIRTFLTAFRRGMTDQLNSSEQSTPLPIKEREKLEAKVLEIDRVLKLMGDPQGGAASAPSALQPGQETTIGGVRVKRID